MAGRPPPRRRRLRVRWACSRRYIAPTRAAAYQVHPDRLSKRGTPEQKYIAERIFTALNDAHAVFEVELG